MAGFLESLRHRRCWELVAGVNEFERQVSGLTADELRGRSMELRARRRRGEALLRLAPEMYALVREACRRVLDIRQYDVQVAGAAGLAGGCVIEMNTGEGKTFIAPMAACLYALDRRGVHVLTSNDYLAGRDHALLEPVYEMLGFTSRVVLSDTPVAQRARAYRADITYTTVRQLGFDFLRQYFQYAPEALRRRDIWRFLHSDIDGSTPEKQALRGRHFAVLDEVDSILIDSARAPLSLSVEAGIQRPAEAYERARAFALRALADGTDFTVDRARRKVELTDRGKAKIEELEKEYGYLHLMSSEWQERLEEALTAEHLFTRGEHYVVQGDEVLLVDETSGRLMLGQRLGEELHQALEAKEGVPVRPRRTTARKITVQGLIRAYENLAGMTGTAWEARGEFKSVYDMAMVRFAPRRPLRREFREDLFFCDSDARWEAVASAIQREHERGRPVLVGTRSVEKSQRLSEMLDQRGVPHQVLNAVDHAREAEIIAEAGLRGRVTVATRMAGRGVEIKLGEGVEELGGLHVIGTERDVLRRIDKQLAGRCGRRGQPGSIQFYASLEDDLLQILPERRRGNLKRRHRGRGGSAFASKQLESVFAKAQGMFARHYANVRQALLAEDLAEERADTILFGQQNL